MTSVLGRKTTTRLFQRYFSTSTSLRLENYYETLHVPPTATKQEIKASYFELSKQNHPDHNEDPAAKEKFYAVSKAYETLGDEDAKRAYDRELSNNDYTSRYAHDHSRPPSARAGNSQAFSTAQDAAYQAARARARDGRYRTMWETNNSRRSAHGYDFRYKAPEHQHQHQQQQDGPMRTGLKSRGRLTPSERVAREHWQKATDTKELSAFEKFVQYSGITFAVFVCFSAAAWMKPS